MIGSRYICAVDSSISGLVIHRSFAGSHKARRGYLLLITFID